MRKAPHGCAFVTHEVFGPKNFSQPEVLIGNTFGNVLVSAAWVGLEPLQELDDLVDDFRGIIV
jgi:hypothetical protein